MLEFSEVTADWFKPIYDFHSFKVLPVLGKLFAGDADSYQYLAESIRKHPPQAELKTMMEAAGFARCDYKNLSTGGALIACKQAFAKKGATLVVKFRVFIGEIESLLSIDATVCSIQTDATDGMLYGVKFNDIKPETQITLTAFVYQTLRETSA